jgi:tripartite-type tricarboxylate transporter receptor subunit TctC
VHAKFAGEGNTMRLIRRQFLYLACAAGATSALSRTVEAQTYPSRSVRVIVPFAAGGPATVLAHVLAQPLTEIWGQSFYVENLPTGASNVGTATAAKAPAIRCSS